MVEELADLRPFMLVGQYLVTPTRTDEHRSPIRLLRPIDRNLRLADIGEPDDTIWRFSLDFPLWPDISGRAGRPVRPEIKYSRL
jgi:hypothetical protein